MLNFELKINTSVVYMWDGMNLYAPEFFLLVTRIWLTDKIVAPRSVLVDFKNEEIS